jgi:hypothetical protein
MSLVLLLGLAWSAPSSAAPNARPAKLSKSRQAKTQRATSRSGTARRSPLRSKASSLRLRKNARSAEKKTNSAHSPEVPAYALKLRESLTKAIDANFEKFPNQAKALPKDRLLYHSIKETSHRELWKGKYEAQGVGMIGEWMTGGKYGGIWTTSKKVGLFGGEGWYSDKGSAAVRITLKKNSRFIDLDDPVQKQIYKDWKKLSGQDTQPSPKDLFQKLKGPDGTPLAKRLGGIGAPTHGDFLVHMGIAGVIHYDTYGQGNPVLINPHAIEKVEF